MTEREQELSDEHNMKDKKKPDDMRAYGDHLQDWV